MINFFSLPAKIISVIVLSFLLRFSAAGQDSSTVVFSGYAEVYYNYDFDRPATNERPFFLYNHKRHNEVTVNMAFAKAAYQSGRVRANLGLMAGTYTTYNLAAEPPALRHLYEANIGVRLSRQHNLWLDAGIMPSHIGFESAVAADCWTPGRSLLAENSPYYEAGVKLTATNKKGNFFASVLLLNGWQRIQRLAGISTASFGLQLNYKPADGITLNYSNFLGTDQPDSLKASRIYHNLYAVFAPGKNWGLTAGFDVGSDKNTLGKRATWYTPVVIVRRSVGTSSMVALRGEYFKDKNQVLLRTNTPNGFAVAGASINYDRVLTKNVLARIEWKSYFSKDPIFAEGQAKNNQSVLLTLSIKM